MTDNWHELQRKFRIAFLRRDGSVEEFASQLPISRRHAYRIAHGQVQKPSQAMRRVLEQVIGKSCQVAQSSTGDSDT